MGLLLVAAVVLLIAALVLRSAHPNRALAIALVGIVGAFGAGALFLLDREPPAPASIDAAALALSDTRVEQDRYGRQLAGQIHNSSKLRLGTLTLKVTYKECAPEGACRVLDEEHPRLFLALPPEQTKGFSVLLAKAALLDQPHVSWECAIDSAQADF